MKKRNTILIVDDLEMNRAILSNIFKKKYDIAEAIDGDEAIEYVRNNSNSIVAILLDLVMPNVSGIEVLKTLKEEKLGEEIPVFIITADNSEEVMYEAYELGVKDILEKPFVPYFLKKRIDNVIELYKMREEKRIEVLKDDKNLLEMLNKVANIHSKMEESEINNIKELAQKFLSEFEENR